MIRAVALSIALTFARVAGAEGESASAAAIFDEAKEAFDRKDYTEAAQKFDEANRRAPRGQTAFNAALSWESAGEPARAADDYALALEDASLPHSASTHARARLTALERVVMTLRLESSSPARATIAHHKARALPATLHLRAGAQDLVVRFEDGRSLEQQIEARAGEQVTLRVAPPAAPSQKPLATPPPSPPPRDVPDDDGWPAQRTIALVSGGAAVIALGAGFVLGAKGVDARDEFNASQQTDADARSRAVSLRTWANVSFTAAAVFAVSGVVLWLTAPRSSRAR
jgi:hypothetical protein